MSDIRYNPSLNIIQSAMLKNVYPVDVAAPARAKLIPAQFIQDLNRMLSVVGIAPLQSTRFLFTRCAAEEQQGDTHVQGSLPPRLGRVIVFIEEHLEESLNLDRLADEANLSKYYFSRVFRDEVGQTPWAYVREARIKKAKTLLEEGVPPAEVAVESGFFDQSHFTKVLKEVEEKTPKQYQKEHFQPDRKNLQE